MYKGDRDRGVGRWGKGVKRDKEGWEGKRNEKKERKKIRIAKLKWDPSGSNVFVWSEWVLYSDLSLRGFSILIVVFRELLVREF